MFDIFYFLFDLFYQVYLKIHIHVIEMEKKIFCLYVLLHFMFNVSVSASSQFATIQKEMICEKRIMKKAKSTKKMYSTNFTLHKCFIRITNTLANS